MTRTEFLRLRRLGRTFVTYASECANTGNERVSHLLRWFLAEYQPDADAVAEVMRSTRHGAAVFHTEMLRPESNQWFETPTSCILKRPARCLRNPACARPCYGPNAGPRLAPSQAPSAWCRIS